MSGNIDLYEKIFAPKTILSDCNVDIISRGLKTKKAIEYLRALSKIESVLFGASPKGHIQFYQFLNNFLY